MLVARGVAASLALALLAGCSIQVRGGVRPASTRQPSIVGTEPSAVVVSRGSGPPGRFAGEELRDALLTVDDLSPGWTVGTSTTNRSGMPATGCPPLDLVNSWPGEQAVVGFYAGDGRTQLVEGIVSTTPEQATKLLATARQVIDQCLTITIKDNRGDSHVFEVTEPVFPRLGDDSYAVCLGAEEIFYDTTVMARRGGEVLMAASYTATADTSLLEPFARNAFEKLEQELP